MRIWNSLVLVFFLTVPGFGQTTSSIAKAPTVPILREAALPMYPPIWVLTHLSGKVIVLVTVKDGRVVGTDVKSGEVHLQGSTISNLKTWHFDERVNSTFTVTYTYTILGEESDNPTNPRTEILPSLDVNITARIPKQIVEY
jgi:hypothetical protein